MFFQRSYVVPLIILQSIAVITWTAVEKKGIAILYFKCISKHTKMYSNFYYSSVPYACVQKSKHHHISTYMQLLPMFKIPWNFGLHLPCEKS